MARPQGMTKTGGRKLGTPNKSTTELHDFMSKMQFSPFEHLQSVLAQLDPYQQAKVCLELMTYLYPKRKAVEISLGEQNAEDCRKCSSVKHMSDAALTTAMKNYEITSLVD